MHVAARSRVAHREDVPLVKLDPDASCSAASPISARLNTYSAIEVDGVRDTHIPRPRRV